MTGSPSRGSGGISKVPLAPSKDVHIEMHIRDLGKAKETTGRGRLRLPSLGKPMAQKRGRQRLRETMGASKYQRRAIVIANYHRLHGDGYKKLHAHIGYVERPGAGEKEMTPRLFDRERDEMDSHKAVRAWEDERHYWRIILAPDDGGKLPMVQYTREFMAEMEKHLGTRLDWMAGAHEKGDKAHELNRHAHIIVRGLDDRGADLIIDRETIKYEFRRIAGEIATRHLGQLSERELERQLEREREREREGEKNYHLGRRPKKENREHEMEMDHD